MTTYRAVMLTAKGSKEALDVLKVVELPVPAPGPGQLRVRVRAAGVGSTDLTVVSGTYLFAPKIPFVPGYEIAGVVEALGAGVAGFHVGQAEKKINPLIAKTFPLLEARAALELLASSSVSGKLVLVA
jgi:NADPH:quinone reductase-like Zn-dependent oxidoreductase